MHHESTNTPFGYQCDFRNITLGDIESRYIEIIWDVASVFFDTATPSDMSNQFTLQQVVPSFLLTDKVLRSFSSVTQLADWERKRVTKYPVTSLTEFLQWHSWDE